MVLAISTLFLQSVYAIAQQNSFVSAEHVPATGLNVLSATSIQTQIEELISGRKEIGLPLMRSFSPKEYGAEPQIWAVVQDHRGVIYVGNNDGVLEFDGMRWRLIRVANNSIVSSLAVDAQGRVYVGAFGEIGYLHPDANGQMTYVSLSDRLPPEQHDFTHVWNTLLTPDGIVFSSYKRLIRIQGEKTESWTPVDHFQYAFWVDNRLFIRDSGRGLLELVKGQLVLLPGGERFANEQIFVMLSTKSVPASGSDAMLIGTQTQGLFKLDTSGFSKWNTDVDVELNRDLLYRGLILPNGLLALGTLQGGLYFINQQGQKVGHLVKANGLSDNTIVALTPDREGALWIGTGSGIVRAEVGSPLSRFDDRNGLIGTVYAVHRHRGQLYVGTSQGLFRLEASTPAKFQRIAGVSSQTWTLLSVGEQLLAGNLQGVYIIENDTATLIKSTEHAMSLHVSNSTPGRLYIGERNGLSLLRWTDGRWIDEGSVAGIAEEVRTMFEDHNGQLWLGTRYGGIIRVTFPIADIHVKTNGPEPFRIERFGTAQGLPSLKNNWVYPINSSALFATEAGVYRFVEPTRQFEPDPRFSAMFAAPHKVSSLVQDKNQDIWLFAKDPNAGLETAGLAVWNKDDGSYRWNALGLQALRGPSITGMDHIHYDAEGIIWFGTADGLVRLSLNLHNNYSRPFSALIRQVSGRDDNLIFAGNGPEPTKPLTYKDNMLRFEFAAPSFDGLEALRFQVFLEGSDNTWSDWRSENHKEYNNLFEGDYRFRVRAVNLYGTVSSEAEYMFTLLPPWHRTVWAYLVYLLIVGNIVWIAARWRFRRLRAQKHVLEALVSERTTALIERSIELQSAYDQLEAVSLTDQLTGLKNRRFLTQHIENDIAHVHRQYQVWADNKHIGPVKDADLIFFLIDLDHFKQVNDIYGHTAGDAVLVQITDILKQVFRETDYLVRWGGEEFLVVAKHTNRENAAELAERLRMTVEKHHFVLGDGKILTKTCSIGFACYPFLRQMPTALEWSKVIDVADHCLYAAKKSRRNAWVGLESNNGCEADRLFHRLRDHTKELIQSNEVLVSTSIPDIEQIIWH